MINPYYLLPQPQMAIGCGLDLSVVRVEVEDLDAMDFSQSAELDGRYCVLIDVASGECVEEGDNDILDCSDHSYDASGKTTGQTRVPLEAYINAISQRRMWSARCKSNPYLTRTWVLRTYEQRTCFMDWYVSQSLCRRMRNILSNFCTEFCKVLDPGFRRALRSASQQFFGGEPLLGFIIIEYNVRSFKMLFYKFLEHKDSGISALVESESTYNFNRGTRRDRVFKSFLYRVIKKLKVFADEWNEKKYRERSDGCLDFARVF